MRFQTEIRTLVATGLEIVPMIFWVQKKCVCLLPLQPPPQQEKHLVETVVCHCSSHTISFFPHFFAAAHAHSCPGQGKGTVQKAVSVVKVLGPGKSELTNDRPGVPKLRVARFAELHS